MRKPQIYYIAIAALAILMVIEVIAPVIVVGKAKKSISPNLIVGRKIYYLWLSSTWCSSVGPDMAKGVLDISAYPDYLAPGTDWNLIILSKKPDPSGIGYDITYRIDYCNWNHDINLRELVGIIIVLLYYD